MAHCQKPSVTPGLFVRGVLLSIKKAAKKSPTRRPGAFLGQSYLSSVSPGTLAVRSEEHTSELQSLMRISYAVFCLKKKTPKTIITTRVLVVYCLHKNTQLILTLYQF